MPRRTKTTEEFVSEIDDLSLKEDAEYTLLSEYEGYSKTIDGERKRLRLKIRHNICGNIWHPTVANFKSGGTRCPECSHPSRKRDINWVKEKVEKLTFDDYEVLSSEYGGSNKEKLRFKHYHDRCNNHEFEMAPLYFIHDDQRCPKCAQIKRESKYIKYIKRFLNENNINYQREKEFSGCENKNKLPFDIYIPDRDLLIEYDGEQHKRAWFNNREKLRETRTNDFIRNKFIEENEELSLLRLSCKLERLAEILHGFFLDDSSTTIERYSLFYIE